MYLPADSTYTVESFPKARAFIGYFKVAWHLAITIPAKRLNMTKSLMSGGNSAMFPEDVVDDVRCM